MTRSDDAEPADRVDRTLTSGGSTREAGEVTSGTGETELARPEPRTRHVGSSSGDGAAAYEVLGELGRGGMGRVLRARDRRLGREVALKELTASGDHARLRFEREARITALLQHPSIVPVYEVARGDDGRPFYAMKLVRGETLSARLGQRPTLRERLGLLRDVAAVGDAIAYAHSCGVIHRDLKASNVVMGAFGEVMVIDWGLARKLDEPDDDAGSLARVASAVPDDDLTQAGAIMGTPAYMPPEQAAGDPVDRRADVYALGAMLYHVVAGEAPYPGRTSREILSAVIAGPPQPLEERVPDAPRDLVAIVAKAMRREPESRYADAGELAAELHAFLDGGIVAAHTYGFGELVARWLRRHRAAVTAASVALIALAVFSTLAITRLIAARDRATASERVASAERDLAQQARTTALRRADEAILASARAVLPTDPRAALERIATLSSGAPQWREARVVAADAIARGVRVPLGTIEHPAGLAVGPDGTVLAIGSDQIVRARPGQKPTTAVCELCAVAVDGTAVAWREGDEVVVETRDRRQRRELPAGTVALAVAPGGHAVATAGRDGVWVLDIDQGDRTARTATDLSAGASVEIAEDGASVLLAAAGGGLRAWARDGREIRLPDDHVWVVGFSPDGRWLTWMDQTGTVLHEVATGRRRVIKRGRGGGDLRVDPTGRWLAWIQPFESEVFVHDLESGTNHTLTGHTGIPTTLTFDSAGMRLATATGDGEVRVWDLSALARLGADHADGHETGGWSVFDVSTGVHDLAFDPASGQLVTVTDRGAIARWPVPTPRVRTLAGASRWSPDRHWLLTMTSRGMVVASSTMTRRFAGYIPRWSVIGGISADGRYVISFEPPVAWGRDAAVLAAVHGKAILRWELEPDVRTHLALPVEALEVAITPDASTVVAAGIDGAIYLVRDGASPTPLPFPVAIQPLAGSRDHLGAGIEVRRRPQFTADGSHLLTCDGGVQAWRATDWEPLVLPAGERCVTSRDGRRIAIGGQTAALTVCVLSSLRCAPLPGGDGARPLAVEDDGSVLAERGPGTLVRWGSDAGGGRVLGTHRGSIRFAVVSPDGASILASDAGGDLRLWDVATGAWRPLRGAPRGEAAVFTDGGVEIMGSYAMVELVDDLPQDEPGLRARIAAALAIP